MKLSKADKEILKKYLSYFQCPHVKRLLASIYGDMWRKHGDSPETLFISVVACELVIDDVWINVGQIINALSNSLGIDIHPSWKKHMIREVSMFFFENSIQKYNIREDTNSLWWTREADTFYNTFLHI